MIAPPSLDELVGQFTSALETKDNARLAGLKQAASLVAAEQAVMQTEAKRLEAKYGEKSKQAQEVLVLVGALGQQQASLAADVIRAGTPTPRVDPANFVVYGRILDAQGSGVSGAEVAAVDAHGSPLAEVATIAQGSFEMTVPLKSSKRSAKAESADAAAAPAPVSFQLVVNAKNLERPYTSPETLTGVAGMLAYREINLPDDSASG